MKHDSSKKRCAWCNSDLLYIHYHDTEWGVPLDDDLPLFEFLNLEGMQAGLSWLTILKKRAAFREAFANFRPDTIARFNERHVMALMKNANIIRNERKIRAVISNANAFLEMRNAGIHFSEYLWSFVDGKPIINHWQDSKQVPVTTDISDALAKDLKKRGFKFVGSTICYAFMQAVGMVNDHTLDCFKHPTHHQD